MSDMMHIHLVISGRVQGVGYRYWLAQLMQQQGVDGWVRNMRDGTVAAAISGPDDRVRDIVERCNLGPASAAVTHVAVTVATPEILAQRIAGEAVSILPTL